MTDKNLLASLISGSAIPVKRHGVSGVVSAGVTPETLPPDYDELGAWYDSSSSSSITASAGRVSQWNDKKGDKDLIQEDASKQPLLVEADLNDLDIINFTGSRRMAVESNSGSQPTTWYLVMTAQSAGGSTERPLTCGTQQFFSSAITNRFSIWSGEQIDFIASPGLGTTQFYVWTLRFNGGSSEMLLDDTSKVTGDAGAGAISGTLTIGGTGTNYSNNKFGEILRYDADVSSENNDLIMTYLNDKWGL